MARPKPSRRPWLPAVEVLEDRILLSGGVSLSGGTLSITGTAGSDTVLVQQNGSKPDQIAVTLNGVTSTFKVTQVKQIQAQLGAGNDAITLDESSALVKPPLSFDGGTGKDTLTVKGTAGNDAFSLTGSSVSLTGAGTLQYTGFESVNLDADGGSDSLTVSVTGDFNGSLTNFESASVSISGTLTVGSVISSTNFSSVSIGTLAGLLQAVEVTGQAGTGLLSNATFGTISGTVLAGSIVGLKANTVAQGAVLKAAGQGTTSNVSIGTLSGSFTAPEDGTTGSGVMSNTTITSVTSTGTVSTGSISGMTVGTVDSGGSITAAGQGTTSNVSIGTLSGSFTAPEDSTAPPGTSTGVMSATTIGTITSTGAVSTGSISGMTVGTCAGSITAAGQGTTSNVSIGTLSGSFTAPEDSTTGSGVMSNTTITSVTSTGTVSTGSISGMTVGTVDSGGSITAAGQGKINDISIGSLGGTLSAKLDNTPGSGALNHAVIGTLKSGGKVNAANASGLSITTVGGTINVTNSLSDLTAGTVQSTASLTSGHFGIVKATQAAPVVQLVEPTVTRSIQLISHVPNGATAGGAVRDYGFYYDGTGAGNPRVVILIAAGASGTSYDYDLGVLTDTVGTAGAGFDLAGLYVASGQAGVRNVVVGGDLLLGAVPAAAADFLGLPNSFGGVQLSQDNVAVAVAGNAPAASISARNVVALAAGSFAGVSAAAAGHSDAVIPLASGTALAQANDNYQVFVGDNPVAQFLVTGPGGSFDNKGMLFGRRGGDNHPITAKDFLASTGSSTSVSEVDFTGKGGSLTTAQPILNTINATGATLGDLILSAPHGIIANITADAITGNIDATNGGISGVIQTAGDLGSAITDPATGKITGVTCIHAGGGGLTSAAKIISGGNLISQVNLKSGLDGTVAAGGDIGVIQLDANGHAPAAPSLLTRFGGIVVSTGGLNGHVVALGNVFGDISITGGLSGRIAVHGREEFGLSAGLTFRRTGILGNVSIGGGISGTGAIVSLGLIGDDGSDNLSDDSGGTHLSISGTDKGILAAAEDINFGATGSLNQAGLFENVGPGDGSANVTNANVIDWIFTDGGNPLTIPAGLGKILADLDNLKVVNGNLKGTTR